MTQACGIYFARIRDGLRECVKGPNKERADRYLMDAALYTGFNKAQREELVSLYKSVLNGELFICDGCAERFYNEIDMDAHLFNNKHCNQ